MNTFTISCESTVDLPFSEMNERGIPVIFYNYSVDGMEFADDMGRNPDALTMFYEMLDDGAVFTTSQINKFKYYEFFESLLARGDLLHIAFGSGMTPSVQNAVAAAEDLREKYPERKIVVIDSLCSSCGYGMLVNIAANMRDEGCALDDVADKIRSLGGRIHHQFYSTDMTMYRRSGRVSGAAAAVATILSIFPIMRLDECGRIVAYDKVRGVKAAINRTVEEMAAHAENGENYDGICYVGHSHCPELAKRTADAIEERFAALRGKVKIYEIGTIIASHSGPGTVAAFFVGDKRE